MLKVFDGAIMTRDTQDRIEMLLVFVDDALEDGNPFTAQRKWRSIMRKIERFDDLFW